MIEICRKCQEPYVLNEERYSPGERVERVCQGCGEVIVFNIPKPERAEPEHVASSATPTMSPPASPPVATPEPVVPAPPPTSSVPPPTSSVPPSTPPPTQSAPATENDNQNKTVLISIIAVLVVVLGVVLFTNLSRTSTTADNEVSDSIAKATAAADAATAALERMAEAEGNSVVDSEIRKTVETPEDLEAQDLTHRITTVKGNRVNLREYASTSSRVIGQLNTGDKVQIISGTTESSQSNSGVLTRSVTLYNSSGYGITLNKGKAVHIQGYSNGKVKVSFDNGNSTLSASVDPSDVETIASETWIQVETMSGKVGWILSRFLNINI